MDTDKTNQTPGSRYVILMAVFAVTFLVSAGAVLLTWEADARGFSGDLVDDPRRAGLNGHDRDNLAGRLRFHHLAGLAQGECATRHPTSCKWSASNWRSSGCGWSWRRSAGSGPQAVLAVPQVQAASALYGARYRLAQAAMTSPAYHESR
ncbi:MAG: hypothetical protein R2844_05660 [Caldilineales bacterium]